MWARGPHKGERGIQNMKEKEVDRTVRTNHVTLCVSELFSYDLCQCRKSAAFCVRHTNGLKLV